jgi:N-acetylmuramoyl-L-alanine amidase
MRHAVLPLLLAAVIFGGGEGLAAAAKPARASPPPAASANRAVAIDARLAGDGERTRLVIDLSRKVELAAFTLADPYRVVVDLPDVAFELPRAAGKEGRGLVSAYRYGLFAPGKSRIVLDVTAPVAIDKAFVLEPVDDQPARLVIDLVRTDRASFTANAPVHTASITPRPAARPPHDSAVARDSRPVVIIDPGHGGLDTGAIAPSGVEEKAVVLAVAKILAEKLERSGRFRVVMTRSDDVFIALGERVRIAREHDASLFISIHADSISRSEGDASGATVYTVSDRASDAEAARLAEKENKADLVGGLDLSDKSEEVAGILFELAHRETRNFSGLFARTLVGRMQEAARMHKTPLKSAGFKVLRTPDVPSVLLELGYLSNTRDLRELASDVWRDKVAGAIAEAVQSFFANRLAADARK